MQGNITTEQTNCSLAFDTSAIQCQLSELIELLKSRFSESIPDEFIRYVQSLSLDVIFLERSSAVCTDGSRSIIQGISFGSGFERLRAALLAGDWNVGHDENTLSRSDG